MLFTMSENYFTELLRAIKDKFIEEIQVGDIGLGINEAISSHIVFRIRIGGLSLPITDAVVSTWIAIVVIAALAYWLGKGYQDVPKGKQVVTEGYVGLFMNLCRGQHMTEAQAEHVAPFIGTMAALICISNCFSVFKLAPPAKDPVFPITLAIFTVGYVIFTGIQLVGLKGFWKSLIYPKAALIPFKILDYMIKPISLSLRLFGNIFGAYILMEFIYIIFPVILPGVLGLWFDIADGLLQGAVFSYLSIIYIGEIIEGAHHDTDEPVQKKRIRASIGAARTATQAAQDAELERSAGA
ncbi:MAG: F0F1 ATP synthase subunit A [Saccharofermentanales bacterium]